MIPLLLGYLDPEDRISLEKLIGKGGGMIRPPPPFSFKLPRLYLGLRLSLECFTKGGLKWTPLSDSLKKGVTKWNPLMNHKEA